MANGSIRKRERADGVRYEAVVDFGLDPATGKRIQRSRAFKTKQEAREYLTAFPHRGHEGNLRRPIHTDRRRDDGVLA